MTYTLSSADNWGLLEFWGPIIGSNYVEQRMHCTVLTPSRFLGPMQTIDGSFDGFDQRLSSCERSPRRSVIVRSLSRLEKVIPAVLTTVYCNHRLALTHSPIVSACVEGEKNMTNVSVPC